MKKNEFTLTKSKFVDGMTCPKHLWLCEHGYRSDEILPMTKSMRDGIKVGKMATRLFRGLTDIPYNKNQAVMVEATKQALKSGASSIAEAAFEAGNLFCRIDILEIYSDGLVINEVKGVTRVRTESRQDGEVVLGELLPEYLLDAGFQYYVLSAAGYEVKQVNYIYLNNKYVRDEKLDLQKLFVVDDVTEEIEAYNGRKVSFGLDLSNRNVAKENIERVLKMVTEDSCPDIEVNHGCRSSRSECEMWSECGKFLPSPCVFDLAGACKKDEFFKNGLFSFKELKKAGVLNEKQQDQVDVYLSEKTILDIEGIKAFLDTLTYPLYFLDFETFQDPMPRFKGQWPYEQVPFQYSLDIIEEPGAKLIHKEFLGNEGKDPRRTIAESIIENIPDNVCVTAYHKSFESLRLQELAAMFPDLSHHLTCISDNLKDFEDPFRSHYYLNKEMEGRSSIKKVLPALFPNDPFLDYKELPGAQNGTEAMEIYTNLVAMEPLQRKKERLYLLRYCGLDTFAMVKVYEALLKMVEDDKYEAVAAADEIYTKERIERFKAEDADIDKELFPAFYKDEEIRNDREESQMELIEKLDTISRPKLNKLENGSAKTIEEFWDNFIEKRLPSRSTMLKWNDVLMDYVVQPNAMFAIRNGNTARKFEYDKLRRGFLTKTSEGYSFFYTDNFHAAYYLKMAMDGFVPSVDEMVSAYNSRKFPARFGIDTSNERELMAIGKGKNPGIQNAGYKIAHIFSVNEGYYKSNHSFGGKDIIDKYFPIGERSDWKYTGELYLRDLIVKPEAREYLVAQFMRFVHPFNYFLTPKKTCCSTSVCKDIAEYGPLIEYVRCRYADMYGKAYEDYLDMIMVDKKPTTPADGKSIIDLSYGLDAEQKRPIIRKTKIETALKNKSDESIKNGTDHADHSSIDIFKTKAMELQIIMELNISRHKHQ